MSFLSPKFADAPQFLALRRKVTRALAEFKMIDAGDKVLVAVSGGKDSTLMALLLEDIRRRSAIDFTLEHLLIDQGQPGFDAKAYQAWMVAHGVALKILSEDTYSIVKDKTAPGKSYCGLCSRLRRGILYNYAYANGCAKIALGHHRDDINITFLMNLFYSGANASMPPMFRSDDGRNTVIRPMSYIAEDAIKEFVTQLDTPVIPCNLCGSQDNLRRAKIKKWLRDLATTEVDLHETLFAAQGNLKPDQLLDRSFARRGSERALTLGHLQPDGPRPEQSQQHE